MPLLYDRRMMTGNNLLNEAQLLCDLGVARTLRQASGMSMADAAKTIEVDTSTISRWEAGRRRLTGDAGMRYAHLIDLLRRSAR
jgi:DNA-binding transcriptional regulator YiaG